MPAHKLSANSINNSLRLNLKNKEDRVKEGDRRQVAVERGGNRGLYLYADAAAYLAVGAA